MATQRTPRSPLPHVAVVGAGFAGLRCADILHRNGVDVTIFEARDRVGGRVHQHTVGEYRFDMGPNWIHGTEGNPITALAEKTGTLILEPDHEQIVFDRDGHRTSDDEATALGADTWATVVEAFKYSNEHCADIDPAKSLLDYFEEHFTERFPDNRNEVRKRLDEARMWGPFVGSPIDRQSLKNFYLEECLDGENVFVASSYTKILAEVAATPLRAVDVRLNQEVVNIEYRSDRDTDEKKVTITTARDEKHTFDEVVVTCPLGWLKRHQTDAFSPALPQRLSQAIENISYGNLEKVYVTFPTAWWTGPSSAHEVNGTSKSTDDNTASRESSAPLFTHFHHPTYHPDPASKENEFWNQSVVSMAHMPGPTAKPTLLFYMYGPCSLYMISMVGPHAPGSAKYNSLLWRLVEPFVSRLPFYSASDSACSPVSFLATQWSNDPYSGYGSYSNFQVGLVDGDEDIRCMRDAGGLGDAGRGLWLAGEHTAPFVAIGTTTGAYWSGENVAKRILNRYGIDDVKTGDDELNGLAGNGESQNEGEGRGKVLNGEVRDGANLSGLAI